MDLSSRFQCSLAALLCCLSNILPARWLQRWMPLLGFVRVTRHGWKHFVEHNGKFWTQSERRFWHRFAIQPLLRSSVWLGLWRGTVKCIDANYATATMTRFVIRSEAKKNHTHNCDLKTRELAGKSRHCSRGIIIFFRSQEHLLAAFLK